MLAIATLVFALVDRGAGLCATTVSLHADDYRFNVTLDCFGFVNWTINTEAFDEAFNVNYPVLGSVLGCSVGQTVTYVSPTEWKCSYPSLNDEPDTLTLLMANCSQGELPKFDGSHWHCAQDENTCPISNLFCENGQMIQVESGGRYQCHTDSNILYQDFGSCPQGDLLKNVSGKGWACAPDQDTDELATLSCPQPTDVLVWNAAEETFVCTQCIDTAAQLCQVCEAGFTPIKLQEGWGCAQDINTDICGTLTGCVVGDLVKVINGEVVCAPDLDSLGALGQECNNTNGDNYPKSSGDDTGIFYCSIDNNADLLRDFGGTGECEAPGEVIHYSTPGGWVPPCQPDSDLVETEDCPEGELLKWEGSQFVCAVDLNPNTLGHVPTASCQVGNLLGYSNTEQWECVIDHNTLATTLLNPACSGGGEMLEWNGAEWTCTPDTDTLKSLGASGTCLQGDVARYNAITNSWYCSEVVDTLASLHCATNQTVKWNATAELWECGNDIDTDTADHIEATQHIDCVGLIIKWINGTWTCAPDLNSDILAHIYCPAGRWPVHNSSAPLHWDCSGPFVNTDTLAALNCSVGQIPVMSNNSIWQCGNDLQCQSVSSDTLTVPPVVFVNGGYPSLTAANTFIQSNLMVYGGNEQLEPTMIYSGQVEGMGVYCRFPDSPKAGGGTTLSVYRLSSNSTITFSVTINGGLVNGGQGSTLVITPTNAVSGGVGFKDYIDFGKPVPFNADQRMGFTIQTNAGFYILNNSDGTAALQCQATLPVTLNAPTTK